MEVRGVDNIVRALDSLYNEEEIKAALNKACAFVVAEAVKNVKVKGTGNLQRSIEFTVEDQADELIGIVYSNVEYAPYVEYGTGLFAEKGGRQDVPWTYYGEDNEFHITSGMKPMPFLRPAVEENREKILDILKGGVKK